jgi:hypothetical protein
MKNYTQHPANPIKRGLLFVSLFMIGSYSIAQSQMYGDTIFWENFGTGTTRSDIAGLGQIGGLYKYEGDINYVYAINPEKLQDFETAHPGYTYVTETPTFHDAPILTTSPQYAIKPTATIPVWDDQYFRITSWRNRTFSAVISGDTEDLPYWEDPNYTYATGYETTIPCAWILVNSIWRFGFYYITYENTTRSSAPDDGHYAVINDLDSLNGDYLKWHWHDHTGVLAANIATNPYDPYVTYDPLGTKTPTTVTLKPRDTYNGRMLFVNCAAVAGVTGPVYKRLVTELCRDAEFEFSAWVASVHYLVNNSQFRIEFWSADPGNDPSIGSLDASYEGLNIPEANNAKLIKVGVTTDGVMQNWIQIKQTFKLTEQDYIWVVLRNYGAGGQGNDIVVDDLVFRPWAPFNLTVELSAKSINSACVDGLVTMLSYFPHPDSIPAYIDVTEYGFYFEGERDGNWTRIGSNIPLQTQQPTIPLELTIPLSEYNLYDRFRVAVATKPSGFGAKCVTFTNPPALKEPIPSSPEFRITGLDVCNNHTGTQQGSFVIKNTNQTSCDGWHVKVKLPNGNIQTFVPDAKVGCP